MSHFDKSSSSSLSYVNCIWEGVQREILQDEFCEGTCIWKAMRKMNPNMWMKGFRKGDADVRWEAESGFDVCFAIANTIRLSLRMHEEHVEAIEKVSTRFDVSDVEFATLKEEVGVSDVMGLRRDFADIDKRMGLVEDHVVKAKKKVRGVGERVRM
jgi:hypothetical protein